MILIELDTGDEELFKSSEELGAAIRRGAIGPNSRIYHRRSAHWLPITVHPEFRKVAAERANQPLPPLKRRQWTFLAPDAEDEQLALDPSPSPPPSHIASGASEGNKKSRPGWGTAIGKALRSLRFSRTT